MTAEFSDLVPEAIPRPTSAVEDDAPPDGERSTDWNSRSAQQARHAHSPAEMPTRSTR